MEQYQGAEAFLEVLNENGIEHIFFNPGGDICPVQMALMKYKAMGKRAPRLVLCLHESVALTAAYGHYFVSGKPQVVMVHSELGTQQTAGAVHNAQWGRVPVILMAGLAPAPHRTTWKGEPYDQGNMVRNCVKWDHVIGPDEDIHDVMKRAFDTALSEHRGPVYLSYPRDTMTRMIDRRPPEQYRSTPTPIPQAESQGLEKIADVLLAAKDPLIMAGSNSRYPETIRGLIELAEAGSISVMTGLTRMNFPTTHPLCAGMEEIGGGVHPNVELTEADVILALDYDLPYVPGDGMPRSDATILQIDVDPMTQGRPLWGRGASTYVKADSREAIPSLTRIIKAKTTAQHEVRLQDRARKLSERHAKEREEARAVAASKSTQTPISPDWLAYCLDQVIAEDTVLVNHLISQSSSVAALVDRTEPGTLVACAGGSIMWALGAALGAKVAAPKKTVVSLMTDGGFVWGCPVAALWSANSFRAPFMSVIFNNQSYGAIRAILEKMSESHLSEELGYYTGVDIAPPADYALIAQACGGYGRRVYAPDDVLPALKEGLEAVNSGKLAVVDVRLAKGLG